MFNLRSESGKHIVTINGAKYIFDSITEANNFIRKETNYAV